MCVIKLQSDRYCHDSEERGYTSKAQTCNIATLHRHRFSEFLADIVHFIN